MPLPPLPPSNTLRVFLDYTSANIQHTFMFRLSPGSNDLYAATTANRVANVLVQAMQTSDFITGARYAVAGSDVTLPLVFVPRSGGVGGTSRWVEDPESAFVSLPCRDAITGRKARFSLFTPVNFDTGWPLDNRFEAGENPNWDSFRNALAGEISSSPSPAETITSIAGYPLRPYEYLNVAKNAYWQRKQRQV